MEKMRQWSMLTGLAVVVVFAAGWFLAVSPQRHHAAGLRTQAATQQAANAQLMTQVGQLKQQQQGLPAQQRLLDQIAAKVPDNPALPALIRELSTAANAAGVDLVSMAPSPPTPVTAAAPVAPVAAAPATGASKTTTAPVAAPAALLNQISVAINVQGSYYNIESFFAAVEKMKRAMRVTQFSMSPGANASGSPSGSSSGSPAAGSVAATPDMLNATLTALVYESPKVVQPTQVAPVAAAATSK
jgi:Tfp pilus assembly protein PilO